MATDHPKYAKKCAFCKYWIGNAGLTYVNSAAGYKYDSSVKGRCTKQNGGTTPASLSCSRYAPSPEAEKLL